jgi:uncharacterized protein YdhG (YjbR/CyaY superfamily)
MKHFTSVDDYIKAQSAEIVPILNQIRAAIQKAAPLAEECISYGMPTYKQHGPLVYFAACKSHIGFYPTPSAIVHFKTQLSKYIHSKGAVQFSLDKKMPITLMKQMVKFKIKENSKNNIVRSKK